MDMEQIRKAQGARLAAIRVAAGFRSAREAAIACNWPESSYRAHENGSRTIGWDDAARYATRFRSKGAKDATGVWILHGDQDDPGITLEDLVKSASAAKRQEILQILKRDD
jgi:hypothetical protein